MSKLIDAKKAKRYAIQNSLDSAQLFECYKILGVYFKRADSCSINLSEMWKYLGTKVSLPPRSMLTKSGFLEGTEYRIDVVDQPKKGVYKSKFCLWVSWRVFKHICDVVNTVQSLQLLNCCYQIEEETRIGVEGLGQSFETDLAIEKGIDLIKRLKRLAAGTDTIMPKCIQAELCSEFNLVPAEHVKELEKELAQLINRNKYLEYAAEQFKKMGLSSP